MSKYRMLYWVHMSDIFEVEANSEEDAKQKLLADIEAGNCWDSPEIGDDGIECLGEIKERKVKHARSNRKAAKR